MDWFKSNKLRGQLPENADVLEVSVGPWSKVEIFVGNQMLSRRLARDLRMARLLALADALGRVKSFEDPESKVWFFRPTSHQARAIAVLDAVRRWAWVQWVEHDFEVPKLLDRQRLPIELASFFGINNGDNSAFQKPLSFFEAELGILHLNFSVFAGTIDQKWYVGSHCGWQSEDPWLETLNDWAWQHSLVLGQAKEIGQTQEELLELSKLKLSQELAQRGKISQWPGLRMEKVEVIPLENKLGFWARATPDGVSTNKKSCQSLLLASK